MKETLNNFVLSAEDTILKAMACIDHNTKHIALVVEGDGRLVGTVTDGDLRRALLQGAAMDAPVGPHMNRTFTAVRGETGRAEVLDLMRARYIEQVPILDKGGRLIGLHVMREIIGMAERPNWAVIMAGGRGERLRPLTDTIPKPMLCVAGRPILERIVLHLVSYGIREIYLSVNYLSEVIRQHFGDGAAFGCVIRYLQEDRPLHTGGALSLLPGLPRDPLIVMNGDLITQVDVGMMIDFHRQREFMITVGTDEYTHTVPFGCLEVTDDNRITRLEEKPVLNRLVNAGVYVLSPQVLGRVPCNQAFPITALIEQAIALGESVGAFRIAGEWLDVGRHDQLAQARQGS